MTEENRIIEETIIGLILQDCVIPNLVILFPNANNPAISNEKLRYQQSSNLKNVIYKTRLDNIIDESKIGIKTVCNNISQV